MTRDGNGPERSAFRSAFFIIDFSTLSIFALSIVMSIDYSVPLLAAVRS